MPLLLEGQVAEPVEDPRIAQLEADVRMLRRDLQEAKAETLRAQRQAAGSVSNLRRQLKPLYHALQQVFGEMDTISGSEEDSTASSVSSRATAVWQSWKQKMPGMPATFIDVLLAHGSMNAAQLRIAAKCGNQTVYDTIHKLNKAGLIDKQGGRFSLKQL